MLFKTRTKDDQADSLAHYLPQGELYEAKWIDGTNLRKMLRALASELQRYQTILEDTATEYDLSKTQALLNEWEKALGIPSTCFNDYEFTNDQRRTHLLMMLNDLHDNSLDGMVNLAAKLGYTIKVEPCSTHGLFPAAFPIYLFPSGKDAKFSIIIHMPAEDANVGFQYAFPIKFIRPDNRLLRCLFNRMKPANVEIFFVFDQGA
jgi:uncharacterized protein YmfQ (DUF2313 family)